MRNILLTLDTGEIAAVLEEAKGYHNDRLHLVACLAKFAKIDGVVTKNEIAVVEEIFGFMTCPA